MHCKEQSPSLIFRTGLRATTAALGLAIALVLTVVLTQSAPAQTYQVIHNFTGGADGASPFGLVMDKAGNLNGSADAGGYTGGGECTGLGGCGTVFKLVRKNSGWVLNPLYNFTGGNDGASPVGLIVASDGTLFGTTVGGGCGATDCGTVFNLKPSPTACKTALCPWTETVLYRFTPSSSGVVPVGGLVFDQAGNLYGTAVYGGSDDEGVVYELTPSDAGWTESVLHDFTGDPGGNDGAFPFSGVIFDKPGGNLYGTTINGGKYLGGTVYELTPSSSGWTENILYSFQNGSDGNGPQSLIFDQSGNLYGTTGFGGTGDGGTVFELSPSNGSWTYKLLYAFTGNGKEGPSGNLVFDQAGNLYGTTSNDGAYGYGSVFKLTPSSGQWTETDLYSFCSGGSPCSDGSNPEFSDVVFDRTGNLYGTASLGGKSPNCQGGCGVVWEITP